MERKGKQWPKKCKTKFCRGSIWSAAEKSPYCGKCRTRKHKERNPLLYAYTKLKHRAKERGHAFELTFEEYRQFALDSGYFDQKGKTANSLSIDRIDSTKGYSADNIRAITLSENTRRRYVPYLREYEERCESEMSEQNPF